MNLILLPILNSIIVVGLAAIPALIGLGMRFHPGTARRGGRVLVYASLAMMGGVISCWLGFALVFLYGSFEPIPLALCWASGPVGMAFGVLWARRFLGS